MNATLSSSNKWWSKTRDLQAHEVFVNHFLMWNVDSWYNTLSSFFIIALTCCYQNNMLLMIWVNDVFFLFTFKFSSIWMCSSFKHCKWSEHVIVRIYRVFDCFIGKINRIKKSFCKIVHIFRIKWWGKFVPHVKCIAHANIFLVMFGQHKTM